MLLWLASFWIVKASAPAFPSRVQNVKATSLLEIKCPADFSHLKPSLTYTPGINLLSWRTVLPKANTLWWFKELMGSGRLWQMLRSLILD